MLADVFDSYMHAMWYCCPARRLCKSAQMKSGKLMVLLFFILVAAAVDPGALVPSWCLAAAVLLLFCGRADM